MASTDAIMNLMNFAFVITAPNLENSAPHGKDGPNGPPLPYLTIIRPV